MESLASRRVSDAQKQANLKRQIAELQAQLVELPEPSERPQSLTESVGPAIVAPATPSPKKKRKIHHDISTAPKIPAPKFTQTKHEPLKQKTSHLPPLIAVRDVRQASSTLLSQLHTLSAKNHAPEPIARTSGFEEKPANPIKSSVNDGAPTRDNQLALLEDLEPGPVEHKSLPDDPMFEKIEPNSGIRLTSRVLAHDDVQEHLTGRYFLPPSLLYSVARLTPDKQAYDVPVEGDWVTIVVVAERGEVKFTNPGPGGSKDEDEDEDGKSNSNVGKQLQAKTGGKPRDKGKAAALGVDGREDYARRRSKKFVHVKLVDLGHRSRTSTANSSAPRGTLRGDAQLNLLLFESDSFDKITDDATGKTRKAWKGGSGGAFEECFTKLREGTVIALLNPKVLRPFQNMKNPSSSHVLALTPPSSSAIAIIGHARDLGMCSVRKRDGKTCGSWVDRRISSGSSGNASHDVCEYHVQNAVQRARAGRAEFSIGTSGMTTTAKKQRGNKDYDPSRQWGLQPASGATVVGGEAMYIIGGHVAPSSSNTLGTLHAGKAADTMGREGQARAKRRADQRDEENALKELLGRERSTGMGGGAAEVVKAARALIADKRGRKDLNLKVKSAMSSDQMKEKGKLREDGSENDANGNTSEAKSRTSDVDNDGKDEVAQSKTRRGYSVHLVKHLGFDPVSLSVKVGGRPQSQSASKKPVKPFPDRAQNGAIHLGPPPGKKVRSGVTAPAKARYPPNERTDDGSSNEERLSTASLTTDVRGFTNGAGDDSESELEFEVDA